MKTPLLQQYSTLAMGLIAGGNLAQAQISYTNVDPDEQIFQGSADYDIDGDGSPDIRIEHGGFSNPASYFWYASVEGLGFGVDFKGAGFALEAFIYGDNIGPGSNIGSTGQLANIFGYTLYGFPGGGGSFGNWINRSDRYIGFELEDFLTGAVRYGWMRLDTDSDMRVTVKDFAIQQTPGVAITAGDQGTPMTCVPFFPPENLDVTYAPDDVILSWDPIPGSVACQIEGTRFVPSPTLVRTLVVPGTEVSSVTVPRSALAEPGFLADYSWRVRCACSLSPLSATAFSAVDVFSVTGLKEGQPVTEQDMLAALTPNPAYGSTIVSYPTAERNTLIRIFDVLGQEVDMIAVPEDSRSLQIDVSDLDAGVYFVQVGDAEPVSMEVIR